LKQKKRSILTKKWIVKKIEEETKRKIIIWNKIMAIVGKKKKTEKQWRTAGGSRRKVLEEIENTRL